MNEFEKNIAHDREQLRIVRGYLERGDAYISYCRAQSNRFDPDKTYHPQYLSDLTPRQEEPTAGFAPGPAVSGREMCAIYRTRAETHAAHMKDWRREELELEASIAKEQLRMKRNEEETAQYIRETAHKWKFQGP